jgi:hypothetical protein
MAQQWEVGAAGGAGFLNHVSVTAPAGSATSGFQTGGVFSGYVGYNSYKHLGGELRYTFMQQNLRLSSGGSDATFAGRAHVVEYDLVLHTARSEARTDFFAIAGGGLKVFQGMGTEAAYQPLSQFGYFTKTQVLKPVGTVGGGIRSALRRNLFVRAEVRDYITQFPTALIAPAPGAKYGSLLNDIVPMVGLTWTF